MSLENHQFGGQKRRQRGDQNDAEENCNEHPMRRGTASYQCRQAHSRWHLAPNRHCVAERQPELRLRKLHRQDLHRQEERKQKRRGGKCHAHQRRFDNTLSEATAKNATRCEKDSDVQITRGHKTECTCREAQKADQIPSVDAISSCAHHWPQIALRPPPCPRRGGVPTSLRPRAGCKPCSPSSG